MDKVCITGLRFHAKHGCHPEERLVGGDFVVDLIISTNFQRAANSDQIHDAIDYVRVMEITSDIMMQPRNLIETVAKHIGQAILNAFEAAEKVDVTVKKIQPPVSFQLAHVSVSTIVERSRNK